MESARNSNPLAVTALAAHTPSTSQNLVVNRRGVVIGPNPADGCNYSGHDKIYHKNARCRSQHPELGSPISSNSLTMAQKAKKWEEHAKANTVTFTEDSTAATAAIATAEFPLFEAFGYTTSHSSPTIIFLNTACSRHMVKN